MNFMDVRSLRGDSFLRGTPGSSGGGVVYGLAGIVRSLTVHMGVDEESALRDFVTEINERVTVHVFIQDGQNRMQDERDTDFERTSLASSTFEEENGRQRLRV
mgnify:CR=1 FL=1